MTGSGPAEITAALADAGAEILRALVAVSDEPSRRRHIGNARRLLSIAYGSAGDQEGDQNERDSA